MPADKEEGLEEREMTELEYDITRNAVFDNYVEAYKQRYEGDGVSTTLQVVEAWEFVFEEDVYDILLGESVLVDTDCHELEHAVEFLHEGMELWRDANADELRRDANADDRGFPHNHRRNASLEWGT